MNNLFHNRNHIEPDFTASTRLPSGFRPDISLEDLKAHGRRILDAGKMDNEPVDLVRDERTFRPQRQEFVLPRASIISDPVKLGEGGMGAVYRCTLKDPGHPDVPGIPAIVKIINPELATDPSSRERFMAEAKTLYTLSRLLPPGSSIPRFYIEDQDDRGTVYYIQELLPGHDLHKEIISAHSLREQVRVRTADDQLYFGARLLHLVTDTLSTFPGMLRTLDGIHRAGAVHRDLKPENLIVVRDPQSEAAEKIVIIDFGLAKTARHESVIGTYPREALTHGSPGQLRPSAGTKRYMSPEQAMGLPLTSKSDVFAMGIILYELSTGTHPFEIPGIPFQTEDDPLHSILTTDFGQCHVARASWDSAARIPTELYGIISDALKRDPRDRPDAGELALRLQAYTDRMKSA